MGWKGYDEREAAAPFHSTTKFRPILLTPAPGSPRQVDGCSLWIKTPSGHHEFLGSEGDVAIAPRLGAQIPYVL